MSSLFDGDEEKTFEANEGSSRFFEVSDSMKAFDAACRKLSVRMYTEKEIAVYLKKLSFDEAVIREATAELKKYGYINDERYAEEYFRYAKGKNKADARIVRELAEKGIPQEISRNLIEDIRAEAADSISDDREIAEEVAEKMLRVQLEDCKPIDEKFLARVGRRLAGLGYDSGTIYGVMGKLRRDERKRQSEFDEL